MAFHKKKKFSLKKYKKKYGKEKLFNRLVTKGATSGTLFKSPLTMFPDIMRAKIKARPLVQWEPVSNTLPWVQMKLYASLYTLGYYNGYSNQLTALFDSYYGGGRTLGLKSIAMQYNRYKVVGIKYKITFVNKNSGTLDLFITPYGNDLEADITTLLNVAEDRHTKRYVLQPLGAGGKNSLTVQGYLSPMMAGITPNVFKAGATLDEADGAHSSFYGNLNQTGPFAGDPEKRWGLFFQAQNPSGDNMTQAIQAHMDLTYYVEFEKNRLTPLN